MKTIVKFVITLLSILITPILTVAQVEDFGAIESKTEDTYVAPPPSNQEQGVSVDGDTDSEKNTADEEEQSSQFASAGLKGKSLNGPKLSGEMNTRIEGIMSNYKLTKEERLALEMKKRDMPLDWKGQRNFQKAYSKQVRMEKELVSAHREYFLSRQNKVVKSHMKHASKRSNAEILGGNSRFDLWMHRLKKKFK